MTSRQRIVALCEQLERAAVRDGELGQKLLAKANEELSIAERLRDVLPKLSDAQCDHVTRDWKEESKAN